MKPALLTLRYHSAALNVDMQLSAGLRGWWGLRHNDVIPAVIKTLKALVAQLIMIMIMIMIMIIKVSVSLSLSYCGRVKYFRLVQMFKVPSILN